VILELLEHCLTPCTWTARSMGFLTSTIQVRSRFKRCKEAWHPHLERTRATILEAVSQAKGRRKALLFGAGLLHDIPLRELAASFEEVLLADIVHSLPSRLAALRFRNVRLLTLDVTCVMSQLARLRKNPVIRLPTSEPGMFLEDSRLDLVLSVNLLSQLGWVPGLFLEKTKSGAEIAGFQRHLLVAHLEYLRRFRGHVALITDVNWHARPRGSALPPREWGVLHGLRLPAPDFRWEWAIAPAPERERAVDYATTVHGYLDWKRAATGWDWGEAEGVG
jgi:hypothetical protein